MHMTMERSHGKRRTMWSVWRYIWLVLPVLALSIPAIAPAQEQEREEQRREEARRRLERARQELEAALRELTRAETGEARRRLTEVMAELRRAQLELRQGINVFVDPGVFGVTASTPPQMGVYLRSDAQSRDRGGAEIRSVVRGGPADEAGLRAGDVITEVDGHSLTDEPAPRSTLVEIKNQMEIGDTLHVEYRRDGETRTADVVLGRVTPFAAVESGRFEPDVFVPSTDRTPLVIRSLTFPSRWLSLELVTLDERLGEYFGTSEGLLVIEAPEDETLGLESGDVILRVDGREPESQSHLMRILRSYAPGETMEITIMRDKRQQTLTVTVPERERGGFWEPGSQ